MEKAMHTLERMIGNTYEYEGRKMLIYDVKISGNKARLITDKDEVELPLDGLDDYLSDFHFVKSNQLIKSPEIVDMVMSGTNVYSQLQSTLLETIKKVQDDAGYIGQAQAINDTIKQVIDLEKVKIQTIQLLK